MLPIGPLMVEHRLIERIIYVLKAELQRFKDNKDVEPVFIDNIVDFIRTYADQTHHGKEEDFLFRELKKKEISVEHRKIMEELIEEHIYGRTITGDLVKAKEDYLKGKNKNINIIIEKIKTLVEFYPKHIEKEDKQFFIPVMQYFTKEEQNALLLEGQIFDRKMIHRKYNDIVIKYEKERKIISNNQKTNWIEYI